MSILKLSRDDLRLIVDAESGQVNMNAIEKIKPRTDTPDVQKVEKHTTEELHRHIASEFASIGAPFWEDRANQAHAFPNRLSFYALAFDRGSENIGEVRKIKNAMRGRPLLWFVIIWCFSTACTWLSKHY